VAEPRSAAVDRLPHFANRVLFRIKPPPVRGRRFDLRELEDAGTHTMLDWRYRCSGLRVGAYTAIAGCLVSSRSDAEPLPTSTLPP
jgi:hypothetical protein